MTNRSDVALIEILPANITRDPQVESMAQAIQPELDAVKDAMPLLEIYGSIDVLPEPILRMLAVEHRVYQSEWELAETIQDKRELIKNSFDLNKKRGTKFSIERVFTLLNINAVINEWFEYGGEPYSFKIEVDVSTGVTEETIEKLTILVERYKPLRSPFSVILKANADQVNAYSGAANTAKMSLDVLAYDQDRIDTNFNVSAGVMNVIKMLSETKPN